MTNRSCGWREMAGLGPEGRARPGSRFGRIQRPQGKVRLP